MTTLPNGPAKIIRVTPTVAEAVYHANDCIGGKQTMENVLLVDGGQAFLNSLCLTDASNQKPALEIVLLRADPTAATLTDHAAIVWGADISKIIGVIHVAISDWATVGGAAIATVTCPRILEADSGNKLFFAIMAVGAPDFVATTDLALMFGFDRYR